MRTVFLGTSDFAAAVLARLAASPHRPLLVITRPDRPRGRGRRLASPPVAELSRKLGIELDQPSSVNDETSLERIRAASPEAVCVCAFGALIKEPLLSDYWMLNVHPSLLPRWRGAAPIERAIMAGDDVTGVSIMRVSAGLDSGPVCLQATEDITSEDTYGSLALRLQEAGGDLLVRTLEEHPSCHEQDETQATYAEKITAADRELDPARTAAELERQVRGLSPHIGAHVRFGNDEQLGVREVQATSSSQLSPGELSLDGVRPMLGCAEGALELLVVQPPGRRAMSGEDYLRGLRR